jgi:hypothetical protein
MEHHNTLPLKRMFYGYSKEYFEIAWPDCSQTKPELLANPAVEIVCQIPF